MSAHIRDCNKIIIAFGVINKCAMELLASAVNAQLWFVVASWSPFFLILHSLDDCSSEISLDVSRRQWTWRREPRNGKQLRYQMNEANKVFYIWFAASHCDAIFEEIAVACGIGRCLGGINTKLCCWWVVEARRALPSNHRRLRLISALRISCMNGGE